MNIHILDKAALQKALAVRDLSDPQEGEHAIQVLLSEILSALRSHWNCEVHIYRESPIVSVEDNYDKLGYPEDGPARAARYTRYVCDQALLRTSTSAMVPRAMRKLKDKLKGEDLIACPGLVYRRDSIDRLHLAEIHQLDLWRISKRPMSSQQMEEMIEIVLGVSLPGMKYRLEPRVHPYTREGLQIDVWYKDDWVEIGECGLAHPNLIRENLTDEAGLWGLAMGLGMDRLLMLRKGMTDIRLVASTHPRIARQMMDLAPYEEVSFMPPVRRDLSLLLDRDSTEEELGDLVREHLGEEAQLLESLEVLAETYYEQLPVHVLAKLGMKPTQKNLLLRITFRALDRNLTDEECNVYRDRIYACLHQGTHWEWASEAGQQGDFLN